MKEKKELQQEIGLRADGTQESELTRLAQQDDEEEDDDEDEEFFETVEDSKPAAQPIATTKAQAEKLQKKSQQLEAIIQAEKTPPRDNIMLLMIMFVVVLALNLLKGGGAFQSPIHITCGSSAFWVANLALLGWIILVAVQARSMLVRKHHAKLECGYEYSEQDIIWDERNTVVYPGVCCLAGFFAGMFGIGRLTLSWCCGRNLQVSLN